MDERYQYSEFNNFNRFENLDSVESKIILHLLESDSKHANNFWKLLKYNDINALSQPDLTSDEKKALIYNNNGEMTSKRVFFQPFISDAWQEQCCSVYIFVSDIYPFDHVRSNVSITVETVVHSNICSVIGDGDPRLNDKANPNDYEDGKPLIIYKNRATVLLKCILAELNGLYLDGIGYLQFNGRDGLPGKVEMPMWINHSYYGHATQFVMAMSGESGSSEVGF